MSEVRRTTRALRYKCGTVLRRLLHPFNVLTFMIICAISFVIVNQVFETNQEFTASHLDEFQPAKFTKHTFETDSGGKTLEKRQSVRNQKLVSQTQALALQSDAKPKDNIAVAEIDSDAELPPLSPPKHLPVIKVQYNAKYPRYKPHSSRKVKFITPKKLTNRDVLHAMAHPRLFPTKSEPVFQRGEARIATSLNDWIQANSQRDRNKFLVYSAYWDDRFDANNNVRILAIMVTKNAPSVYCRLSMADGTTIDARVIKKVMNEHWKLRYSSCFLSCEVPKNTSPPLKVLVSLNRNFTFSAMLPVHQNKENIASPRGDLAVCVKPLHYFYDRATWLLEFIEFHRILGVEHFFFYNHTVGPAVDALLRYYMSQNIVTVLPWSLPILSQKEIRTEAIFSSLNDCVFRTMYLFHYVILLDFDEYIVPREHESYLDMLHQLEEDNKHIRGRPGSFVFKNTFFYLYWENDTTVYGVEPERPPQWVPYFLTQYKTRRLSSSMKVGSRSKYIVVPERILEVGNHVVWRHTSGSRAISVPDTVALLHHYRICEFGGFSCLKKENLVDRTAIKFGPDLLKRVMHQCRLVYPEMQGHCPLSPPLGSPW
ncbi:glycosyltransferase family 92 protein [Trichonephila inaurata madagascariensis]|uniref:Glycosyltransferase family 92 protein n=1 Tax=Trichonephila inaurata madagascariensis TaxID=2747483 RepID=A0A8X6XJ40_9ARAC|nr:glycosyltransferase family 92 protein [Trichonephila inaurata madagascariensis]